MDQSENYTSYKSILKVTLPLILVSLSSYLMMSINRIVLASVSADMMNAVIMSVTFINIFNNFFNDIIEKNCIFISQYYGNKQNDKVATCVWQMIFFSIFLIPVSLGMSFLSEKLHNLPENLLVYGIPYQRLMFSCSFLYFIYTALVTFFISQGKTYIISLSVILGCLINVISSVTFVHNLNFGTSGTAYGNILGTLSQIIFLSFLFFDKKNNEVFKTRTISWDFTLLKKIFKLGLPIGLFNSISTISWFIIQNFINDISSDQLSLYNMIIIIHFFFSYISGSIIQASSTMGANLVAQDDLKGIKRLMKKFIVLIFIFLSLAIGIILFLKGYIIETIFSLAPGTRKCPELVTFCFYALLTWQPLEFLYKLLEGICLSGGDTKFISRTYMTIFISFDFLAILILKYLGLLTSIKPIIYIFLIEPVPFIVIFYLRYKSLRWYNKII